MENADEKPIEGQLSLNDYVIGTCGKGDPGAKGEPGSIGMITTGELV